MNDVLFVVRGDPGVVASTRERVFHYHHYLEKQGLTFKTVIPPRRAKAQFYLWPSFYARILCQGLFSKVIFVQKDIFALWLWRLLRALGKKIVYDFDDAIFIDAPSGQGNVFHQTLFPATGSQSVAKMVRIAHCVTVANNYLGAFARQYNQNVEVLPVPIDLETFSALEKRPNPVPTVGWLGSPQTAPFLVLLNPALEKLKLLYGEKIKFKFVTRAELGLKNVPFEQKPWEPLAEKEDIVSFDIGLVPLPKGDAFAEGKSSYKLLQFMAAGIPAVCTDFGYNKDIVRHGQNGFLADTTEQWVQCVSALIESKELREQMGAAARKTALETFDRRLTAARFLKIVANPA